MGILTKVNESANAILMSLIGKKCEECEHVYKDFRDVKLRQPVMYNGKRMCSSCKKKPESSS